MRFTPLLARTRTIHSPLGPVAYDCMKVLVVRDGTAVLLSEFGRQRIAVGDAALIVGNTLCGIEPHGHLTATTLYLDTDYVVDQVFWQHMAMLADRMDARQFVETVYSEPAQVLRLGMGRAGMLMPWLDEMVALSVEGATVRQFCRMQALWFSVAHVIGPFIRTTPERIPPSQRARATIPSQRFQPLRAEAMAVRDLLRDSPTERWTLAMLAERVHLSPKHLSRVFTDTYGKTPLAYLTMLRVEGMARLLRDTELSIAEAARQVGWSSRSRASEAFRQCVGVTPSQYRRMGSEGAA